MFKLLFELLVDPLGLPINPIYEYLVMLVVGEMAYQFAYEKTGVLSHREYMSRGQKSILHWVIRLVFYFAMWAILRIGIWIYGFVVDNKGVSIFAIGCIFAIIATIKISAAIEERNRLHRVIASYFDMKEVKDK